jgi:hypothetical protein
LGTFSKNIQIPNFMKIRSVGAELLHADKQTDVAHLTLAIYNFAGAPKKGLSRLKLLHDVLECDKTVLLQCTEHSACVMCVQRKCTFLTSFQF